MNLDIRMEQPDDFRAVEELTRAAFWDVYTPGCSEHHYLHLLRAHPAFVKALSLVAHEDGVLVGHIAYVRTHVELDAGGTMEVGCFGPVSVLPSMQGRGIGGALIRHALARAEAMGLKAVLILGNPKYYARFGFRCAEKYDIRTAQNLYAPAMMALELAPGALRDRAGRFHEVEYLADEAALAAFDATFPPREKGYAPSQDVFKVLSDLCYAPGAQAKLCPQS